jgi:hypothetical protein
MRYRKRKNIFWFKKLTNIIKQNASLFKDVSGPTDCTGRLSDWPWNYDDDDDDDDDDDSSPSCVVSAKVRTKYHWSSTNELYYNKGRTNEHEATNVGAKIKRELMIDTEITK